MAFEGLNNAGSLERAAHRGVERQRDVDRPERRALLSKYLDRVRTEPAIAARKSEIAGMMESLPKGEFLLEIGKRWKDSFKEFVYHSMIWEELGFTYLGPVDGHDLRAMIDALRQAKAGQRPRLSALRHAKGPWASRPAKAMSSAATASPPRPRRALPARRLRPTVSRRLRENADRPRERRSARRRRSRRDASGTSLGKFEKAHPDRFFDVGIAEQHAVTFAAGLATQGMRPVCAIYSTFLQRAYDQIIHDVCIQRLPVVFAMDRAGFAGDDGPTHHGIFDLSVSALPPEHDDHGAEGRKRTSPHDQDRDRPRRRTMRDPLSAWFGIGVDMTGELHALPMGAPKCCEKAPTRPFWRSDRWWFRRWARPICSPTPACKRRSSTRGSSNRWTNG